MEFEHRKVVILITKRDGDDCKKVVDQCKPLHKPKYEIHSIRKTFFIAASLITTLFLLALAAMIFKRYYSHRHRRRQQHHHHQQQQQQQQHDFLDQDRGPIAAVDHHIWYINTVGLPDSVIEAITVCKYNPRDGLIDGTDCSICLSEFEEDEDVRLLPKCSHAFHIPCIDTWLRSHKNCPLCRAPIVCENATPPRTEDVVESPAVVEEEPESSNRPPERSPMRRSVSMDVVCDRGICSNSKSHRRSFRLTRSSSVEMPKSDHRRIHSSILPS